MTAPRSTQPQPKAAAQLRWTHRLALLLCLATLVLLAAGALVVGTGSGLAVPDWPLANGQVFPPMVGGILFEHGHRLIAATVGILTVVLAAWMATVEPRRWMRWLGYAAACAVVVQGLLGGVTVLLRLPRSVTIGHAMLAQNFFLLAVLMAQFTSAAWPRPARERGSAGRPGTQSSALRWLAFAAVGAAEIEIFLGALVRHFNAGLAIPDFPLALGQLVPALDSFPVAVHFAHRVGALAVLVLSLAAGWTAFRHPARDAPLKRRVVALTALVLVQAALGASILWTQRSLAVTTLHVVNGGLVLASAALVAVRAWMLEAPAPAAASAASRLGPAVASR
ncbi:MAG: heme A synthase [SAR324 cluster bacterium]